MTTFPNSFTPPNRLVPTFAVSQALPPGTEDEDDAAPGDFLRQL